MPYRHSIQHLTVISQNSFELIEHNNESKADVLRRLGVGTVMSYDSAKNKKQVDWVVIPPQEFSEPKNANLASVSKLREKPRPRIILSRTLKFKKRIPYRNPESALVGVA